MSALSWTFIHSLWQGLLLSFITVFVLLIAKRKTAAVRYNLVLILFCCFIITSLITFLNEWYSGVTGTNNSFFVPIYVSQLFSSGLDYARQIVQNITGYILANEQLICICWMLFFVFRMLKISLAFIYNHRIRNSQVYDPGSEWKNTCKELCAKLGIQKAVRILETGVCRMPVVIGHLKPLILIPAGLLTALPAGEIESILLHELAHIRRNDYLVNLLQHIAEAIFFFNPALLWISSVLKEERENSCDDIVLEHTKNRQQLAEALIRFREYELYGSINTAFAGRKNILLKRISRILGKSNKVLAPAERLFFVTGLITVLTAVIISVSSWQPAEVMSKVLIRKPDTTRVLQNSIITIPHKNIATRKTIVPSKLAGPVLLSNRKLQEEKMKDDALAYQAKLKAEFDRDMQQAVIDQQRALADQVTTMMDQEKAKKDQDEAMRDQIQAKRDQEMSMKNKIQAEKSYKEAKEKKEIITKSVSQLR